MCGLVGVVEPSSARAHEEVVRRMLSVLSHRGPDDEGTYFSGQVAFGFRRLSILDLTPAGHQPMSTADGTVTIVFNGEIYNFIELRQELQARGHTFRSSGDSEVLLRSYLEWGPQCLRRLNGMWAFVVHDRRSNTLFGARDRFGIKPLYLYRTAERIIFASEIKSIRASGYYEDKLNYAVAGSFLVEGRLDETSDTFFRGIRQLPAACSFRYSIENADYQESRYWDIRENPVSRGGDFAESFANLFEDAVRLHMRSDVPVGIHLSGGLDSTSIACASARVRKETNASGSLFAFSYIAPEFDESEYIRATVAQTGAHLIELNTSPQDLWADLERMLWFQDEPVHTLTSLVSFQLMRATARHGIKVVLNGQGGDETLAGYPNYFRNYWQSITQRSGLLHAWQEMKAFSRVHVGGGPANLLARLLVRRLFYRLWEFPSYRMFAERRRRSRAHDGWFTGDLLHELPETYPVIPVDLNGALAYSQAIAPLPLYLRLEDRNSMAHSIEVRLPFLDYRLVEFVYSLPDNWKMRGPWNKFVLRQAMAGRIPENVRVRPDKMGFPVPAREWFAEQLLEPALDLLTSRSAIESGRYRVDVMRRDIDRHRRGEKDFTDTLFAVAQFELWLRGLGDGLTTAGAKTSAQVRSRDVLPRTIPASSAESGG
jgi:asparagine synthase (glutamine-hydrolysing)